MNSRLTHPNVYRLSVRRSPGPKGGLPEKARLLKSAPKSGQARKHYAARTRVTPTTALLRSYTMIQESFSDGRHLHHHDGSRPTFLDVDASKYGFGAAVYHVKNNPTDTGLIKKGDI